jgi:hypothetical protein
MMWLGDRRGYLSDWVTQRWVQITGRRVALADASWLAGPAGTTRGIGTDFFSRLAEKDGLAVRRAGERGLLRDFDALQAPDFAAGAIDERVVDFYRRTSSYELDSWAEWCGLFRPFGAALAALFSRRLQQLNVPLSGLDTSRGVTSDVVQLLDASTGEVRQTAWVRQLRGSGNVLYAGSYSIAEVPGRRGACVKVVFPLPNGNAVVLMRPIANGDGSLSLVSAGARFGDPGFYFTVRVPQTTGEVWTRYVRALQETIRVYGDPEGGVRADHVLTLWGATFLKLHYRLRPRLDSGAIHAAVGGIASGV